MTIDTSLSILDSQGLTRFPEEKKTNELGQEEFLELMMAQLKYQDPTSPTDTNEFMSQLAQFSASAGIAELQDSASAFLSSMQSSQALQASALVGRSVLVPTNTGNLPEGGTLEGRVDLPVSSKELRVGIYDSTGQLVRNINLGEQSAGMIPYEWDGRNDSGEMMPAGEYYVQAEASVGDEVYAVDTLTLANVDSVTLGVNGQSPTLNLSGLGSIGLSDVREIL